MATYRPSFGGAAGPALIRAKRRQQQRKPVNKAAAPAAAATIPEPQQPQHQPGNAPNVIPNTGAYLQNQALAHQAYEQAKIGLQQQRSSRQKQMGLRDDWTVDPTSMYGGYQQMLHNQGLDLMGAEEQAQERGFFGSGLGRQMETQLAYGHAVQNLGFKNQLSDWENEYQSGLANANNRLQGDLFAALQSEIANNYGNWGAPPTAPAPPPAPAPVAMTPARRPAPRRRTRATGGRAYAQ